jgi:hypothetical protein
MRINVKLEWGRMTRKERRSAKRSLGPIPMAHLYTFTKMGHSGEWIKQEK